LAVFTLSLIIEDGNNYYARQQRINAIETGVYSNR